MQFFVKSPNKIADFCTFCSGYCFIFQLHFRFVSFLWKKCYFGYHFNIVYFRLNALFSMCKCVSVYVCSSLFQYWYSHLGTQKENHKTTITSTTPKIRHMTCVKFKIFYSILNFNEKCRRKRKKLRRHVFVFIFRCAVYAKYDEIDSIRLIKQIKWKIVRFGLTVRKKTYSKHVMLFDCLFQTDYLS